MILEFLKLSDQERRLYFEESARRRDVSPVIMEKDFWVCWMLGILFESSFAKGLVFKGGTSLSKVFGAIDRFSEDIDLSLSPRILGLPDAGESRTQSDKWMKRAESACAETVREQIVPVIEQAASVGLGSFGQGRVTYETDPNSHSPVILFLYPSSQPTGFDYLKRSVKLEFGSLTDQEPASDHPIQPWIAEEFPSAFRDWKCLVTTLQAERTFWEKATILHAEFHRPSGEPTPDRYSRHYADLAALAIHDTAVNATRDHALRERVVRWKTRFFRRSWARYDLAIPGSIRLVPSPERVAPLRRDYQAMRDMYLHDPPTFETILGTLQTLEDLINE